MNATGGERRPATREELAATVRELHDAGRRFAFVGGGTELGLGNLPRALDTVVRTTALGRVVDYIPGDQVVAVESGMTLAALDAVLQAEGQMLPLDAGDRARATVGGVVATGSYGARRLRYGTPKDLIVGVELVRPDGTRAHGGGKVVKNVAGFDLPKLAVGSLGTLGAIATATFRVHPQPAAIGTLRVRRGPDRGGPDPLVAALLAAQAEPTSIASYRRREGGRLVDLGTIVRFEGSPSGVRAQRERLASIARGNGWTCDDPDDAALAAIEATESIVRSSGAWRARLWNAPSRLALAGPLWAHATHAAIYPALGAAFLCGDDGSPADVAAQRALPGTGVVMHAMPDAWREHVESWGTPPASFPLMRAIKERFDPHARCNPGRFVGGL